jgi:hypothetical protein
MAHRVLHNMRDSTNFEFERGGRRMFNDAAGRSVGPATVAGSLV